MKKKLILFFISSMFVSNINYSWDSTAAKFYPLAVGNSWSYKHIIYSPPLGCPTPTSQYNFIVTIISDTVRNGHRYFKFSNGRLLRIDSTTMNVYQYNGVSECKTDSLLARKNDLIYNTCFSGPYPIFDTSLILFAGQNRRTKTMALIGGSRTLMYEIGLYRDGYCEIQTGAMDELNGCIINGIQYGVMLGIGPISGSVPDKFKLYQNYPNPFNPSTSIKFDVPKKTNLKLVIYDVLSREIETLVDEQLNPGEYEVRWNAENYPSGMYFYSIEAGDFSKTGKMVLIK
ncbi:MAG: T9SS type A sorting domain-containing protein [Chlorobi bacterium]|nr:T9SS type A sorting domain-containing protein [Chlorobiota bacterium]MCI0715946.1 T9SS type A sorting domain-containing protein [Chlorobiota bacterium]